MSTLLAAEDYQALALDLLAPSVSAGAWQWCEQELRLREGRWDPRRAGLLRHWYAIAAARISGRPLEGDPWAHRCEELWLAVVSQIAKTTTLQALIAWVLAEHPRQVAWYGTRQKDLQRLRRRELLPMIERTPALERLLPRSVEARDHALGADLLAVGSSLLYLLVGNLADDVRALPLPLIAIDEFDQLVDDLDGQGDPIDLIQARQRTYPHERLLMGGSSVSGVSRHAWRRLCSGSHERPLIACRECGGLDYCNDEQIVASGEQALRDYPAQVVASERLARLACRHCGALHDAMSLRAMVLECIAADRWIAGHWEQTDDQPGGVWIPAAALDGNGRLLEYEPPATRIRTGWANALYSDHVTLDGFAASMVAKYHHGTDAERRTWVNLEANRPSIHVVTPVSTEAIVDASSADYAHGSAPVACDWLILTLDQQGNQPGRFWYAFTLRAWRRVGRELESWLVAAGRVDGDAKCDELEDRLWPVGGEHRAADIVAKDVANPNYRRFGYLWAAEDPGRRWCLRGDVRLSPGETWREVAPPDPKKPGKTSRPAHVKEWRIHPHHWRTELQEHMLGRAGAWHIPADAPPQYLRSLNAEEPTLQMRRQVGGGYQEMIVWEPRVTTATDERVSVRKDLHWADGEKMQLAVVDIMGLHQHDDDDDQAEQAYQAHQSEEDDSPEDDYLNGVW